jgi:rod shape-determining protein MreC
MFLDQRGGWLESARYALSAAAYPVQLAVSSPGAAWRWLRTTFESRAALQAENAALRAQVRDLQARAMRFESLGQENASLRGLRASLPDVAERWLAAEVISVELSTLRQRLLINKGERNGVFKSQAVIAGTGLLGQVLRVGPWTAEVILVSDPEHAVPVEVLRNGLRTIAVGLGDARTLSLPYLPVNSDVLVGDVLVTSGLGGVFPQGYPVARVTDVGRDPGDALAQVRATPLAGLDRDRLVALVWFRPGHPAAPASSAGQLEAQAGSATSRGPAAPPETVAPREPQE